MTLISSIIQDAFRESNIIPIGIAPNDNQATEALRLYNALLNSLWGSSAGENLQDYPLGNFGRDSAADYCPIVTTDRGFKQPPINVRFIVVNDDPITMDLSAYPQDGSRYGILDPYGRLAAFPVTLNGNGRTIDGAPTFVASVNGLSREWVYRADLGQWIQLTDKAATDENPFPKDFDNLFVTLLATRLNPRYGRELSDLSRSILRADRAKFLARYINSQPLQARDDISWPYMSQQGWWNGRTFSSQVGFNHGYPYG